MSSEQVDTLISNSNPTLHVNCPNPYANLSNEELEKF